ncbi:MAG: hypothetical protein ACKVHO_19505 [Verrucomicrobiia bacterium]|jgi:hypothetical protein
MRFIGTKLLRNLLQNELNPVVIKELRQAVRSWAITGMLLIFLVIMFIATIVYFVSSNFAVSMSNSLGLDLVIFYTGCLIFFCLVLVPLYLSIRLATERQGANLDLLYITTLPPGQIIRGKMYTGIYIAFLLGSATLPFVVLTNLLRGVDLPSIALVMAGLSVVTVVVLQISIFIACLPAGKGMKGLLCAAAGFGSVFLAVGCIAVASEILHEGAMRIVGATGFWSTTLTLLGGLVMELLGVYMLSVALVTPANANRAKPVRIFFTVAWFLRVGVIAYFFHLGAPGEMLLAWLGAMSAFWGCAMLVAVSGRDVPSHRVRRTVPKRGLRRLLAFLFYTNTPGGILWVLLGTVATFMALPIIQMTITPVSTLTSGTMDYDTVYVIAALMAYVFAYALMGLLVHRKFFPNHPPHLAGVFAISLPVLWMIIPNTVLFFMGRLDWQSFGQLQLGNPINLLAYSTNSHWPEHLGCATVMLAVMLILNLPWFARAASSFKALPTRPREE